MIRSVNGVVRRCAVLALAAWWGVSLTFAPLLHRHAAEPNSGDSCGLTCLGPVHSCPFDHSSGVGSFHVGHEGEHQTRTPADICYPGWSSAVPGDESVDAANCPVCHFLTQGQDRAPAAVCQHREALTAWARLPDVVRCFSPTRHSHYSRGPPACV